MTSRALVRLLTLALPLAASAAAPGAVATLKNGDGKEVGKATLTAAKDGVKVDVEVANLPPGKHGIHVHAAGKCDPPLFKAAGAHFNPGKKQHGLENPAGAHAGDLPNLEIGKNGKANASFIAKGATLGEGEGTLFGPEGTAIVIHADPDDGKTDPAGNSGARIACGVVERK